MRGDGQIFARKSYTSAKKEVPADAVGLCILKEVDWTIDRFFSKWWGFSTDMSIRALFREFSDHIKSR